VPLRVFAHFALFALIGLLTTLLIYSLDLQKWYFTFGAPLVFGLLNAIFDEIHQIYSDGRACDISDVIVDFSGVALAVLIINFIMRITLLRSSQKKKTVAQ
jgi:VanZ family protein